MSTRSPAELSKLGLPILLTLSTPEQTAQAENVETVINGKATGIFANATMHTRNRGYRESSEGGYNYLIVHVNQGRQYR